MYMCSNHLAPYILCALLLLPFQARSFQNRATGKVLIHTSKDDTAFRFQWNSADRGTTLLPTRRTQSWGLFVIPTTVDEGVQLSVEGGKSLNFGRHSKKDRIPRKLSEALRVFFLEEYNGPRLVVAYLAVISIWRSCIATPISLCEAGTFCAAVVFWWFQEHVMHGKLLHSQQDWYGKEIHAEHHAKPYYHISIDPAGLMLGWLMTANFILVVSLPLPIGLTATLGYAGAGLVYEWAHFIAHTKVPFKKNSYWRNVKEHHIRHHLVDNRYWLGFSLLSIDNLFGTNPSLPELQGRAKKNPSLP